MIPEQAVEAAALGIINAQRERHGLDPIAWDFPALSSAHRDRAMQEARAALTAARPILGVQATREDVARAIYKSRQARKGLCLTDEQVDAFFAQYAASDPNVSHGGWNAVWCAYQDADAVLPHTGQPQEGADLGHAQRLATVLWEKHWKAQAPDWKVGDNLSLVIDQIDNMVAGLAAPALPGIADEICAACGEHKREHAPGGTRWGPTSLCGVFIPASPPAPVAESGWQEMETAKRDETAILLRFAPSSGFTGCMLCWFDKDNPKGNPWRVPLCDAWFGEGLFDAWMPAPPHIADQREKP